MRPLEGIRVLDFSHMAAGPFCTSLLGDMGADVIKIERPGRGDALRYTDRCYDGEDGSYFFGVNRSKRAIGLDVKTERGREIALRLIEDAHVLIENFRPGAMESLGLGYEAVRAKNPAIVYCSISAFGPDGPLATKPGVDLVVQAMSGVMGHTGEAGRAPVRLAPSLADLTGGLFAAYGILAAIRAAERTGQGDLLQVSLLEGQIALLSNYIPHFFKTGEPSGPVGGAHPQIVPYQVFQASDGHFIVACLTNDFWRKLAAAVDRPELGTDERYRGNADRLRNRDELVTLLSSIFVEQTVAHWCDLLDEAGVPNAPIYMLSDVVAHPQTLHMGSVVNVPHPVAGDVPTAANPARLRHAPVAPGPAPMLGQHTDEVLSELGLDGATVAQLREQGVVG
jgi:crotonobetainyl-CoA:carnitine CoA-transferase CaiB-like acyl-CoA transferase